MGKNVMFSNFQDQNGTHTEPVSHLHFLHYYFRKEEPYSNPARLRNKSCENVYKASYGRNGFKKTMTEIYSFQKR